MKLEMIEGLPAKKNFERAMRAAFRVSKKDIKAAEKREKEQKKRKGG